MPQKSKTWERDYLHHPYPRKHQTIHQNNPRLPQQNNPHKFLRRHSCQSRKIAQKVIRGQRKQNTCEKQQRKKAAFPQPVGPFAVLAVGEHIFYQTGPVPSGQVESDEGSSADAQIVVPETAVDAEQQCARGATDHAGQDGEHDLQRLECNQNHRA